jgi:putative ABC transport system ATP-binding protein
MIVVKNLTMRLHAGTHTVEILDSVSLEIPEKQVIAIVGPSGSGKSTFLGLLAGLDRPTEGSISLMGKDLTTLSETEVTQFRRQHIGYIFQSFHLIPTLSALENVALPLELNGDPGATGRAQELLGQVGLDNRIHHYPVQLSGGEQQRVAVARAFALRPPFLFADEPTGNLDSTTGAVVIDLLFQLNRDHGSTLILVTHDPLLAQRTQRVVTLRDGRIASDEYATPLKQDPDNLK